MPNNLQKCNFEWYTLKQGSTLNHMVHTWHTWILFAFLCFSWNICGTERVFLLRADVHCALRQVGSLAGGRVWSSPWGGLWFRHPPLSCITSLTKASLKFQRHNVEPQEVWRIEMFRTEHKVKKRSFCPFQSVSANRVTMCHAVMFDYAPHVCYSLLQWLAPQCILII